MYNRYIHQQDGSFQKKAIQEKTAAAPALHGEKENSTVSPPPPPAPPSPPVHTNAGGFLRQLLPKDFDTGDLLIVLLMLLMAGDCEEEKNTALLTLALYFFM